MFCNYVIGSLRLPATHLLYGSTSFSCRTASTRAVPMLSNSQNGIQPARTRMLPILCPFMRLNRVAGLSPVGNTHTWNIQVNKSTVQPNVRLHMFGYRTIPSLQQCDYLRPFRNGNTTYIWEHYIYMYTRTLIYLFAESLMWRVQ